MATNVQDPCFRNVTDEFSISPDGQLTRSGRPIAMRPRRRPRATRDDELFSTPILGGAPLPFD